MGAFCNSRLVPGMARMHPRNQTPMKDVIDQALFAPTLPLTVLLVALVVYWIASALGISWTDGDAHADVHADAHADGHAEGNADGHGMWGGMLAFLNVGRVPLMIVITVLTLSMWVISMLGDEFLGGGSLLIGFALLVPAFLLGCVITRFATAPFGKVLALLQPDGEPPLKHVGLVCTVTTAQVTTRYGQAAIETAGSPLIVQVRTHEGETLARGDTALIVAEDAATAIFTVRKVTQEQLEK